MIKLVWVNYGWEGDSIDALYINGALCEGVSGDDYHDNACHLIEGFIQCLSYCKIEHDLETWEVSKDFCEKVINGDGIPDKFPNRYTKKGRKNEL